LNPRLGEDFLFEKGFKNIFIKSIVKIKSTPIVGLIVGCGILVGPEKLVGLIVAKKLDLV
jgi:hypothetical protein